MSKLNIIEQYHELKEVIEEYDFLGYQIVDDSESPLTWDDIVKHAFTVKDYKKIKKSGDPVVLLEPQSYNTIDLYNASILNEYFELDELIKNKQIKDNEPIFKNIYMKVNSRIINKLKKYMKQRKVIEKSKTNTKTTKTTKSTNTTKTTKSKTKVLTPCPEGKVRNPDTNRCKINTNKSKK